MKTRWNTILFVGGSAFVSVLLGWYLQSAGPRVTEGPMLDSKLPLLLVTNLKGEAISLNAMIDRRTVLVVFSVTCPHCLSEMTNLNEVYPFFKDSLRFIALSVSGRQDTQQFIDSYDITVPVVIDSTFAVMDRFRTRAVPTLYLLDQHQRIRQFRPGKHTAEYLFSLLTHFSAANDDSIGGKRP
ncbi:MAG: TlpA family protein disulfide reductase [Bacteroidetes bacterium]|nr:MAG: TlpA family protein disulfide reductase [Bacteroidota bacterium]